VPPEVTKITGISDETLKDAKPFSAHYRELCEFYLGETTLVAHNAKFDTSVMSCELTRLGKLTQFPWPWIHICTVERSQSLQNKYMRLEALHRHYFNEDPAQKHRALDDVYLLIKVAKRMREDGLL
jgi:DNA polymerase III epsilon subunit-like protein